MFAGGTQESLRGTMCHGQAALVPGMRGLFHSQESSSAICCINTQKKNHMILSIHAGKAPDEIENKKNSQKNRNRGNFLNLIKNIQKKTLP